MYVMYVYKTTLMFTSVYTQIQTNKIVYPEDICLAKNSPLTFSDNSESLANLNQSKKRLTLH